MTAPLAGRKVALLGAEGPLGRPVAVALAQAGAKVPVLSLSTEQKADFAVHSVENELWALERAGGAWAVDASDAAAVTAALRRAAGAAGGMDALVTHMFWDGAPDVSGAVAALAQWQHPDRTMIHLLGPVGSPGEQALREAASLLAALGESAAQPGRTRVNAIAAGSAAAAALVPAVPPASVPQPLDVPGLVVLLLSPEGRSFRGQLLVP